METAAALQALVADPTLLAHARDTGRRLADEGLTARDALRVHLGESVPTGVGTPDVEEVAAFVEGYVDATLGYLHRLGCEDPLTGLATTAHLRTRVGELRRAGVDLARDRALVVVTQHAGPDEGADPLGAAMGMAALGETVRVVFAAGEAIARTGGRRVVVLAHRDHRLDRLVALLRRLLAEQGRAGARAVGRHAGDAGAIPPPEVAVEAVPDDELALELLLGRLDTTE